MKNRKQVLVLLHVLLMIYSVSGIFMKLASKESFLNPKFILFYIGVFGVLGIYAIGWQQVIKRMPLTAAYANHAVSVIWGSVWGYLFFHESPSLIKALGIVMIICGIVLFAYAGEEQNHE